MSILAQKVRCYEGEFAEPLSVLTRTILTRFAGGTGRGRMQVYPGIELYSSLCLFLKLLEEI
jgi:hypothetical protein